ncbi:MAG: hypothetical protein ACRC35_13550 [Angustibacter sp.]
MPSSHTQGSRISGPSHRCDLRITSACTGTAPPDARGCGPCRRIVRDELRALPGLYEQCVQSLTVGQRPAVVQIRKGRAPSGLNLNLTAVSVRTSVLGVLASWASLVIDETGATQPGSRQVAVLAAFLDGHLDWVLAHEVAADFAEELTDLTDAARAVLDPASSERIDLGPCGEPGCGLTVYAAIGAGAAVSGHGVCCGAGHHLAASQWLLLDQAPDAPGVPGAPGALDVLGAPGTLGAPAAEESVA